MKKESNKNLSLATIQIENDVSRLEKESVKLRKILTQCPEGGIQYNSAISKYNEVQTKISKLKSSEKRIIAEQNQRKLRAKMTEF